MRSCLNPAAILRKGQYRRLLESSFLHGDDYHLYYNMASLLWKGASIEPIIGPVAFAMMLVYLLVVGQLLYIAAGVLLLAAGYDGVFASCAVGFSGVLFGLKAILNAFSPATTRIWGCTVPTKYAAWAELLVIQLVTPHASMTGHACGILAGLSYIYVEPVLRRALLASGVQGASLGGTVREAAAANPQGAAGMGHAGGGMGMGVEYVDVTRQRERGCAGCGQALAG